MEKRYYAVSTDDSMSYLDLLFLSKRYWAKPPPGPLHYNMMTRWHEADQLPFRRTRLFLLHRSRLAFLYKSRHRERYCAS